MQYFVKHRLHHDGRQYEPGDSVELDEDQGRPLVGLGVLEAMDDIPATPATGGKGNGKDKSAKGKDNGDGPAAPEGGDAGGEKKQGDGGEAA
ncbi:MAG: hypothetical protein HQK81_06155 [Desulfovibrionaceae bacterium]|nr:hypothetical protein [Desulfovibrionaceae bacterium]MBF0513632.1 hypothetical protein [Desulfovibrionaceae bacterium]